MAKRFSELYEATKKDSDGLEGACWKGYVAIGTKMKNGKKVPNCVPETSEEAKKFFEELSAKQKKIDKNKNGKIDGDDLAKLRKEEEDYCDCGCDCGKAVCESCGKPHMKKDIKEDYWHVVYKDKNGKVQGEKDFDSEDSAKKYAQRGNSIDKVGGKYHVNKVKGMREEKDPNEYDKEGDMAKNQLKTLVRNASDLMKMMGDDDNLPEWVQSKITKAEDYIVSVRDYLQSEKEKMNEEKMTDDEYKERERIVKGMKKSFKDFVKKYGSEEKAKQVMYATANKMAKDK